MRTYSAVISAFLGNLWAIHDRQYAAISTILRERARLGGAPEADVIANRLAVAGTYGTEEPDETDPPGVGLVNLHGTVLNRAGGLLGEASGITSPQGFASRIRELAAASSVREIVISVDSPGGTVSNTDDMAAAVREAREIKPITAVVNGIGASAAYWAISGATEIVVTPGSEIGSIGVIASHADMRAFLEAEGIDERIYRTGSRKALGQPIDPNDDAMAADMAAALDSILAQFAADIAAGRGISADDALERYALDLEGSLAGGTVFGSAGVDAGLADRVDTLNGVLTVAIERAERARIASINRRAGRRAARKGRTMDYSTDEALAALGIEGDPELTEQVRAALMAAHAAGEAATAARARAVAGVPADRDLWPALEGMRSAARDGRTYRAHLLDDLVRAHVRANGPDTERVETTDVDAAGNPVTMGANEARLRRVFASASLDDLRAEIDRLNAAADAGVPAARVSSDPPEREDTDRAALSIEQRRARWRLGNATSVASAE